MAIDNTFIVKRFEKFKEVYVLYSASRNIPFIECDETTFDDQVYVFTSQEDLQRYAMIYTKEKYALKGMNYPQAQFPRLFEQLYYMGIDTLQVIDGGAPVTVKLDELSAPPDYTKIPLRDMDPVNPGLQLSAAYFIQELLRPVERTAKDKKHLRELEEEMAVNLLRSKFIMASSVAKPAGKQPAGNRREAWRIPLIKNKAGKSWQPLYTDYYEFRKFNEKNINSRFGMHVIGYDDLEKSLAKGAEGYVFNPAGFNLILSKEQIRQMKKRYAKSE